MTSNNNDFCEFIFLCLFGVYVGFNIDFLNRYYDDWKSCNKTNLWPYNLTSFLLIVLYTMLEGEIIRFLKKRLNFRKWIKYLLIIEILLNIIIINWGFIELFDIPEIYIFNDYKICSKLKNTQLWDMGIVNFSLLFFFEGFYIHAFMTTDFLNYTGTVFDL